MQSFNRALAGSGGLYGLGYWMASMGIISGHEEEDEKLRDLDRERGMFGYHINVSALKRMMLSMNFSTPPPRYSTDTTLSYDWVQPFAIAVAMGANTFEDKERFKRDLKSGKITTIPSAVARTLVSGGKTLEEQPLLRGFTQFMNRVAYTRKGEMSIGGAVIQTVADMPGTFVPALVRQAKNAKEDYIRAPRTNDDIETALRRLKGQFPWWSETLPMRRGMFGEAIRRNEDDAWTTRIFNAFLNPALMREIKSDPILEELVRLHGVAGEQSHIPTRRDDLKITVNGRKRELTPEEVDWYQHMSGSVTKRLLVHEMNPEKDEKSMYGGDYYKLDDGEKQKRITSIIRDSAQATRMKLFGQDEKGTSKNARKVFEKLNEEE